MPSSSLVTPNKGQMSLVICPRCDTLLEVRKVTETFFCRCGVELEHPDKVQVPRESRDRQNVLRTPSQPAQNSQMMNSSNGNRDRETQIPNNTPRLVITPPPNTGSNSHHLNRSQTQGVDLRTETPRTVSPERGLHWTHTERDQAAQAQNNNAATTPATPGPDVNVRRSSTATNLLRSNTGLSGESQAKCDLCCEKFSMFGKWKKKCKSCSKVVCNNCSRGKWPAQMLPKEKNSKNEKLLRVCHECQNRTESFRTALLEGCLEKAKEIHAEGNIELHCPYQIYPYKLYPLHCAVVSGRVDAVSWLLQNGCKPTVTDARGWTCLTLAASEGKMEVVKYLIFRGFGKVREITDVDVLHKVLQSVMIELQRTEIERSLRRHVTTAENSLAPAKTNMNPSSVEEEEAQLRLALEMSQMKEIRVEESEEKESIDSEKPIEKAECIVCFENNVDCVLIPCGHMSCCNGCGNKFKECPVCRHTIEQVVKTYRS